MSEKKILFNTTRDIPDEMIIKLIDFTKFLETKKSNYTFLKFKPVAEFIRDLTY